MRRGPGEWVEHRVDPGEGATLVGWAPRRDGAAAALAIMADPLPPPAGARRVVEQAGVRLVRLYPEIAGWGLKRAAWQPDWAGLSGFVDRRFHLRADGSIDGWLGPLNEGPEAVALGVTVDPDGVPVAHPSAPDMIETVTGGSFAVAISRDGALHESTDHGRTWRAAGRSPVPPGSGNGLSCSAIGCVLGPVVRVGWGAGTATSGAPLGGADSAPGPVAARVSAEPFTPVQPTATPLLSCVPRGVPVPLAAPPPAPPGARQMLSTGWGDTLEIVRDAAVPEPPSSPGPPLPVATPPAVPAVPTPGGRRSPRPSPAVLRTHTLLLRRPFAPFAPARRLNATDASFNPQHRALLVPLLAPSGDVDVLVGGEQTELVVSGDKITVMPAFDGRRYYYGDAPGFTGLTLPGGRALVLGETRRRLALEDHGPGPQPPPLFLGLEHDRSRRRP